MGAFCLVKHHGFSKKCHSAQSEIGSRHIAPILAMSMPCLYRRWISSKSIRRQRNELIIGINIVIKVVIVERIPQEPKTTVGI